uniref:Uncharacterized protein n=1 Tax=Anguilla anguilla TaxID=7936 RepID=A0A0E9QB70_ANGAN
MWNLADKRCHLAVAMEKIPHNYLSDNMSSSVCSFTPKHV